MGGLEQSVRSGGWQVMVMCSKAGSCPFSAVWGGACFKARLTEMLVGLQTPGHLPCNLSLAVGLSQQAWSS